MSFKSNFILILAITTLIFGGVYPYIFDKKLDLMGDNANYYILGKALAAGEGYVNINNSEKTPNIHFPPGYPTIISGLIALPGDSIVNIKLANGLMFLFTLFGLFYLTLKITERRSTSIIVLLFVLFNAHLLRYSSIIMTEVPFMFFSVLALLSFLKINDEKPCWKDPWLYLTIIILAISFYIRTSGIAIIGGIILYLLFMKRWRHALLILVGTLLLVLPWQIRNYNLGGSSYLKQLVQVNPYRPEAGMADISSFLIRFGHNTSRYIAKEIPSSIFPFYKIDYTQSSTLFQWLLGLFILILMIYGFWRLKKYKLLIIAYLVITFGILLLWPEVWIGVRFLLPLVPLLVLGLVNGIITLIQKYASQRLQIPLIWLLAFTVMPFFFTLKQLNIAARAQPKNNWENYLKLAEWAKENIRHDAVIACRKPTIFYLNSNVYTVNYKYTADTKALIDDLIAKKVDYVVIEQLGFSSTYRYLVPAINANMERFLTIQKYENPETYLIKMLK